MLNRKELLKRAMVEQAKVEYFTMLGDVGQRSQLAVFVSGLAKAYMNVLDLPDDSEHVLSQETFNAYAVILADAYFRAGDDDEVFMTINEFFGANTNDVTENDILNGVFAWNK